MHVLQQDMGFITKWLSKLSLARKKRMLEEDAEKVNIRLQSIPEWLYKITLEHPEKVKAKIDVHLEALKKNSRELNVLLDGIRLKDIVDMSISRYKKEVLKTSKDLYIKRMRQLVSDLDAFAKSVSITDVREKVDSFRAKILELEEKNERNSEVLEEFYPVEIPAVAKTMGNIKKELIACKDVFATESYHKVDTIIELVESIKSATVAQDTAEKELDAFDEQVKETQAHIFKLSDKIAALKKSSRFSDILSKEDALAANVQERTAIVDALVRRVDVVADYVVPYAEKTKNKPLVSGYVTHTAQALINDEDLDFVAFMKTFIKEFSKEKSELRKGLKPTQVEKITAAAKWIYDNLAHARSELLDADKKIKQSRKYLKNYVILNEIEDNESRIVYYQGKLRTIMAKRRKKLESIADLKIDVMKEKLHKELLLLTGYDVEIIY